MTRVGGRGAAIAIAALPALAGCASPRPAAPITAGEEPARISTFREHGLGCDWDPSGSDRIAYDAKGTDGFYDVHLARADGSADVCLTCAHPGLPGKHMGAPFWHPRGSYVLFVAEKAKHRGSSFEAIPGFGGYSDVWVMTADGSGVARLTDVPNDPDHGVLPARFSPDGRHVAWTERIRRPSFVSPKRMFAWWVIKVADFVETADRPRLENVRTIQPGPSAFYELSGLSPDGKRLAFCSSMNQRSVWTQQIFTLDVETGGDLRQLTDAGYNEHAFYSPDGGRLVWMSNVGNSNKGTDWWIMRSDGAQKERLTYFNRPGHPHSNGKAVWAGLGSFRPDGRRFVGGIVKSLFSQEGRIVIVDLPERYW